MIRMRKANLNKRISQQQTLSIEIIMVEMLTDNNMIFCHELRDAET